MAKCAVLPEMGTPFPGFPDDDMLYKFAYALPLHFHDGSEAPYTIKPGRTQLVNSLESCMDERQNTIFFIANNARIY